METFYGSIYNTHIESTFPQAIKAIEENGHAGLRCLMFSNGGYIAWKDKYVGTLAKSRKARSAMKAAIAAKGPRKSEEEMEEEAKAKIIKRGYGPRFYAGKCHAIEGLLPGETYCQEQFPGGYDSWQEALDALDSI